LGVGAWLGRHNTQHNDIQNNDIHNQNIHHDNQHIDCVTTFSITKLCLRVKYVLRQCYYSGCRYTENCHAECRYSEFRGTKCLLHHPDKTWTEFTTLEAAVCMLILIETVLLKAENSAQTTFRFSPVQHKALVWLESYTT